MNNEINLSTETAEQNKNKAIAEIAEQKENNETNQASKVSLPVKPVKPLPAMDRADIIMAFAMLFAAYIGTEAFGIFTGSEKLGIGASVFVFVYTAALYLYAKLKNITVSREGIFWTVILLILGSSYTFVYNASIEYYINVFVRLLMLYIALSIYGVLISKNTSVYIFYDGLNALFVIPFSNIKRIFSAWKAVFKSDGGKSRYRYIAQAVLGVIIGSPFIFLIIATLVNADDRFADIMNSIHLLDISSVTDFIGKIIFSLPAAMYFFGLAYGAANKVKADAFKLEVLEKDGENLHIIPRVSIYSIFILVIIIYVIFIGIQAGYFFDALRGILPKEFTYSEYARRGFFELITVCIINICLICLGDVFIKRKAEEKDLVQSAIIITMSVFTLFLIITALTKMFLYINAYGMTPLRVVPSIFMLYLSCVFILIIIGRLKGIKIFAKCIYMAGIFIALLSISNMDGIIAGYNLKAYQSKKIRDYGKDILYDGGYASIPEIYRAWQSSDSREFKEEMEAIATDIVFFGSGGDFLYSGEAYESREPRMHYDAGNKSYACRVFSESPLKYKNLSKYNAEKYVNEMLK